MNIKTKLPDHVHSIEYVKNHHFIKLTDDNKNSTVMYAHGIIKYTCDDCGIKFWMESNMAGSCPSCCSEKLKKQWNKLQLGFIPEEESSFIPPKQKPEEE